MRIDNAKISIFFQSQQQNLFSLLPLPYFSLVLRAFEQVSLSPCLEQWKVFFTYITLVNFDITKISLYKSMRAHSLKLKNRLLAQLV